MNGADILKPRQAAFIRLQNCSAKLRFPHDSGGHPMGPSALFASSETLEAIANIRRERDGTFLITFIDGTGARLTARLAAQAARDLCDELNDSLD